MPVRRSGLSAYQPRQARPGIDPVARALLARVNAMAAETRASSGSRRMAKHLHDDGFAVGRCPARRLRRAAGGRGRQAKPRGPLTTESRPGSGLAEHVLARHCEVAPPDRAGAGDITYIGTAAGWWYVSVLWDVSASKVVGWAMRSPIDTALVPEAVAMAVGRRRPAAGLLHHADRGSPYASHASRDFLADHGMVCSMRDTGEGLDHAVAERFFGS